MDKAEVFRQIKAEPAAEINMASIDSPISNKIKQYQ
jgi:hypothetical protein